MTVGSEIKLFQQSMEGLTLSKVKETELCLVLRQPMFSIIAVAEAKINNKSGHVLIYQENKTLRKGHMSINKELYFLLKQVFDQITRLELEPADEDEYEW